MDTSYRLGLVENATGGTLGQGGSEGAETQQESYRTVGYVGNHVGPRFL